VSELYANVELQMLRKVAVMAYFKVISQNLIGRTEELHQNS
jgi:hypothetical protein